MIYECSSHSHCSLICAGVTPDPSTLPLASSLTLQDGCSFIAHSAILRTKTT